MSDASELLGATNLQLSEEERSAVARVNEQAVPDNLLKEGDGPGGDIRAELQAMGLPQKIKAALFGNSTCRGLLILDSQRIVQEAVLKNPQLQEREISEFTKNSNMSEYVLRRISDGKKWTSSYTVKLNLVLNPKTPQDVSLKWLRYLRDADIKKISRSKNISQVVATAARKRMMEKG